MGASKTQYREKGTCPTKSIWLDDKMWIYGLNMGSADGYVPDARPDQNDLRKSRSIKKRNRLRLLSRLLLVVFAYIDISADETDTDFD